MFPFPASAVKDPSQVSPRILVLSSQPPFPHSEPSLSPNPFPNKMGLLHRIRTKLVGLFSGSNRGRAYRTTCEDASDSVSASRTSNALSGTGGNNESTHSSRDSVVSSDPQLEPFSSPLTNIELVLLQQPEQEPPRHVLPNPSKKRQTTSPNSAIPQPLSDLPQEPPRPRASGWGVHANKPTPPARIPNSQHTGRAGLGRGTSPWPGASHLQRRGPGGI